MPKPIVRKIHADDATREPEQRSAFSVQLEKLAQQQKEALYNMGDDGNKLLAAMDMSDGYLFLSEQIPLIKQKIQDLAKEVAEETRAVLHPPVILPDKQSEESEKDTQTLKHKLNEKIFIIRKISIMSNTLANTVLQLHDLEAEFEILTDKVIDDSLLPNFEALNDNEEVVALEEQAVQLSTAEGVIGAPLLMEAPENSQADDNLDCPLLWKSYYINSDKVMAPTEIGAKAMIAMRIRQRLNEDDIEVWQIDKNGERICKDEPGTPFTN